MKPCYNIAKNVIQHDVVRPISNNHPSLWGDYFIENPLLSSTRQVEEEWQKQRVAELIGQVKVLLKDARGSLEEMELIDALQRLGVAYHFEEEINEALSLINSTAPLHSDNDHLHNIALRFRLLRQHHYHVPSDVFNRFKDDDGNFKKELSNDLKGLWWKDLGLTPKLTFMRDRIVESYFWMLGVYFEPQYSKNRMLLVKVITMLSLMDDIYDSYGTLAELQLFTDAIQRLMDDAVDHTESEATSEPAVTTISCCMKEYGDSLEEAKLRILGMVENAWKDMNRECLHLKNIRSSNVLVRFVNLACMMETIYRNSDGYSEPASLRKPISLLLVEPVKF
ncbi:hypothetical protein J5N97_016897 [Dioscorea zingiberensis]|uniref:Uncharacterized protein n=1 Tax=Dioscorea zingiberensis TaxID=325984 RepID=A0A9D5CKV0_9LILI|nr:hypothetical protein J5N97_016897 [Dioscorea zingiberensis]